MRRELDAGIVPSSARRSTAHEPLLERQEEEDDDLERFDALGSASLRLSFSRSTLRDGSSTSRSSPEVLEGARRTGLCSSDTRRRTTTSSALTLSVLLLSA